MVDEVKTPAFETTDNFDAVLLRHWIQRLAEVRAETRKDIRAANQNYVNTSDAVQAISAERKGFAARLVASATERAVKPATTHRSSTRRIADSEG